MKGKVFLITGRGVGPSRDTGIHPVRLDCSVGRRSRQGARKRMTVAMCRARSARGGFPWVHRLSIRPTNPPGSSCLPAIHWKLPVWGEMSPPGQRC